jgi:O-antigen/teichoic acid export membrane protein
MDNASIGPEPPAAVSGASSAEGTGHSSRAVRNAGLSIAGVVVGTGVLFLSTPLLLRGLGSSGYGIFTLALAVSGVLGLVDFGTATAVTYELAKARHDPANSVTRAVTGTAMGISLTLGAICSLVLFGLAPELTALLNVEASSRAACTMALRIAGVLLAVRFVTSVLNAVFAAYQRFGWLTIFTVAGPTLSTLAALAAVWRGGGAPAATAGASLGSAASLAAQWLTLRRAFPAVALIPQFSRESFNRLWRFGSAAFLTQICGVLLVYADKFIVTRLAGIEAVGDYSVVFSIAFRVQIVLAAMAVVVFPMTSEFAGTADHRRLSQLYAEALRVCLFTGILLLIPLLTLDRMFLTLWISPEFGQRLQWVFSLLSVSSFMLGALVVPHHVLNGLGLPQVNLLAAALVLGVSIVGNLLLVPRFGILGAGAAAVVAVAPGFLLVREAEKALGARGTAARLGARALVVGAISLLIGVFAAAFTLPSWTNLVWLTAAQLVVIAGIARVCGLIESTDVALLTRAFSGQSAR